MVDNSPPTGPLWTAGTIEDGEGARRLRTDPVRPAHPVLMRVATACFVAWIVVAWILADRVVLWRTETELADASRQITRTLGDISQGIERSIAIFHGVPSALGRDSSARDILGRRSADSARSTLPQDRRRAVWQADPDLAALDRTLADIAADIPAFSVIWVMNRSGDCIAASNAGSDESFVGTNYADRDYFRQGIEGLQGHQYAVGRNTRVPGLFFSAPVVADGRVVGVLATKIDLVYLLSWVDQANAFLSDNYGVVVLAGDRQLEMRVLPGATVTALPFASRMGRYRQSEFQPIGLGAWPDSRFDGVWRRGDRETPVLMRTSDIAGEDLTLTVTWPVPAVATQSRDCILLFIGLCAAGAGLLLILLFLVTLRTGRRLAQAERDSRARANALQRRIEERARIEAIRQASEVRLRTVTDNLQESVLVVDAAGRVVFANRSARRLLEPATITDGQEVDLLLRLHIPDGPIPFARSPWAAALTSGQPQSNFDAEIQTRDGRILEVAYACQPMEDEDRMPCLVVSFRDIGAQKKAEREALQSARLISIGGLAAGIAHEINTPAQYISDNLHYIEEGLKTLCAVISADRAAAGPAQDIVDPDMLKDLLAEMPQAVAESRQGVEQIARIVLSMKEFSHPGGSSRASTDINRSVDNILTVSRNAWKHVAEVVCDLDRSMPPVTCHAGEIGQVLLNLIMNAVQAIEQGGRPLPGRITVTTRHDGAIAEIRVADTGPGVPAALRESIFDPFFTTKPVGKGTGQGLAICRDVVVVKHHGTLTVGEADGGGALFIVRLPIEEPDSGP